MKGEEEKRKLAEARVSRACARDVASPLPQWAIRDTETEQNTRDESSNSSRVFVEKRRVFLPLREVDDGSVFTPVRRRANIPDRGNRCTGILHMEFAHPCVEQFAQFVDVLLLARRNEITSDTAPAPGWRASAVPAARAIHVCMSSGNGMFSLPAGVRSFGSFGVKV